MCVCVCDYTQEKIRKPNALSQKLIKGVES